VPLGVSNFVNEENTYKNIYIKRTTRPPSGRLELGLAQKELFLFSLQLVFTSCSCSLHLFVLFLSILWSERTLTQIYITRVTTPLSGRLELGSKIVVFILPSTCVYELFLFSSSILSVPIGFERYTYLNGISIPYRRCNFSNDYQRCSWWSNSDLGCFYPGSARHNL
jgi:hypothetical protein